MKSDQLMIETALECAATDNPNFNADVYEAFFRLEPEAEPLMVHIDELVQGKMLAEVIRLMLSEDDESVEAAYLRFEIKTHMLAYGVSSVMFLRLNAAFIEVLQRSAQRVWERDIARAVAGREMALSAAITKTIKTLEI